MDESTVNIIVVVITTLGSVLVALFGWLARRGVNYLDRKTTFLDEAEKAQQKESLKQKVVDVVTLTARSTMQTFVDEAKAKSADGKLTKEEAKEAFKRTFEQALAVLKADGVNVSKDLLGIVVEAVVGKLKLEKNGVGGEAAAK